jgi:hypothetical protein
MLKIAHRGQQALRLEQTDHKNPHSLASTPQFLDGIAANTALLSAATPSPHNTNWFAAPNGYKPQALISLQMET